MVGHKLYSDSLNSPNLHSTMGSEEDGSVSPPISPLLKERTSTQKSPWGENKIVTASTQNNLDSDNDSLEVTTFYSFSTEKQPYSFHEDVEIVKFVLKDQNIYRVSSILLWKYLEAKKKNPKRTYQSLKNRFLRNIKPKLFTTYRFLVETDDQIKKILDKFPDLEKEAKTREPLLGLKLPTRKNQEEDKAPDSSNTSKKVTTPQDNDTGTSTSASEIIPGSVNSAEEIFERRVETTGNSIVVTVTRKLGTVVPIPHNSTGIYEKYLKFKAENKLIPCSACGRCGGPELDEGQDSDNDVIFDSVESKSPQCSVNSKSKKSTATPMPELREITPRTVKNAAVKNTPPAKKSVTPAAVKSGGTHVVKNTTPLAKKNAESPNIKVAGNYVVKNGTAASGSYSGPPFDKEVPGAKRRRKSPDSPHNTSVSPSLLCSSKSSGTTDSRVRNKKPPSSKSTPSSTSNRKYLTPPEQHSGDLTDKELESLYQETVQECEKLIDSEEEEELVKKCLKKSRRTIGFDSYVLLNKVNLDSFFAKSQSPPWDSSDVITSTENKSAESNRKSEGSSRKSEQSPLVENMKKMLRSKTNRKI